MLSMFYGLVKVSKIDESREMFDLATDLDLESETNALMISTY